MMKLSMRLDATDGRARAGTMTTGRGEFPTPVFMPVGTRAAVKTLDTMDLERLGPPIVLGNTYHLMERPGAELIAELGGLHRFMDWNGHLLTDSGGYQIFSLEPKITEEAATFRSVYDGAYVELSPERSVEVQEMLGADIAMVLDVCSALPSTQGGPAPRRCELTLRWAERSKAAHRRSDQAQFGIVQGGVELDLRQRVGRADRRPSVSTGTPSAACPSARAVPAMVPALAAATDELAGRSAPVLHGPRRPGRPRRGGPQRHRHVRLRPADPAGPSRYGPDRRGSVEPQEPPVRPRRAADRPDFDHPLSSRYSRAYVRHLLVTGEPTAGRIITLHNLAWLADLTSRMRRAIENRRFDELRAEVWATWAPGESLPEV